MQGVLSEVPGWPFRGSLRDPLKDPQNLSEPLWPVARIPVSPTFFRAQRARRDIFPPCFHASFFWVSQKGSPERCRFRFFPFFPFSSVSSVSFSVFFRFFRFIFQKKKNGETPFARPLLRKPRFFPFFSFLPSFVGHPSFSAFSRHLFALFSSRKMLCSVEEGEHHRARRGGVSGWTSPQSSGRKPLPEICVKTGQS